MPKKILALSFTLAVILFFSGCADKPDQTNQTNQSTTPITNSTESDKASDASVTADNQAGSAVALNSCKTENVSLPNYGDPGHRLENCFVQYPGEPSRRDSRYYIVEDICGQFTQGFMENMLGQKITKVEPSRVATLNNCTYFLDEKQNILLNLEYLPIENQKKGSESMGRKAEKSDQISMENLVVWQDDSLINTIYLVLSPNKFISLRPSSKDTIASDKFLQLAANIAKAIKGYK